MVRIAVVITLVGLSAGPVAAQTTIRPGQTIQGQLSASDPTLADDSHYDCFAVQTRAGQSLQIDQTSDAFDSYLTVGTGDCATLTNTQSDDDGGGGLHSRITRTGDGGLLSIRVNSLQAGRTGAYQLRVSESGRQITTPTSPATPTARPSSVAGVDPFEAQSVYVAGSAQAAHFGLRPVNTSANLHDIDVLQLLKSDTVFGGDVPGGGITVDAFLVRWTVNCQDRSLRRREIVAYRDRQQMGTVPISEAFAVPGETSVNFQIAKVVCDRYMYDWNNGYQTYESKVERMRR